MDELIRLDEKPTAQAINMVAGWHQWADAGAISSELPRYLIKHLDARKIGQITSDPFYLFQVPGTHGYLRPEIKFENGHCTAITLHRNELYYHGNESNGLVIFLGEEPHVSAERYAHAFFEAAKELGVKRIVSLGGVYGAIPYDRDRGVSCVYSLPDMQAELTEYALTFSNYEGGVSIGSYLAHHAEQYGMEFLSMYAFVPAYDFSHLSQDQPGMRIDRDFRAWHELMRRISHMFDLDITLADLQQRGEELTKAIGEKVDQMESKMPQLKLKDYIESLGHDFEEAKFSPLDVWERGLSDLFDDTGNHDS